MRKGTKGGWKKKVKLKNTLLEKGRELVKTCLASLGNTVGKQVKIPLENKILTWFVGKRQQAYFIIHHPKGTRFHFHCLMLTAFLGYSLSLLPLSWIYLLISLHFVLFLDQWQWCEHTIIKSDSQKVKNLLAHLQKGNLKPLGLSTTHNVLPFTCQDRWYLELKTQV